jgi:hypothetical protein
MKKPNPLISNFEEELRSLINKYSKENESNTPDFILAEYLLSCLEAFNTACNERNKWYNNHSEISKFI